MGLPRRLRASGAAAVPLLAILSIANGCQGLDCNETLTCSGGRDDVVMANDSADTSRDEAVAIDGGGGAQDVASPLPHIAVIPSDSGGEANDGLGKGDVYVDGRLDIDAADGWSPIDVPPSDAGAKCASSVLVPISAVASSATGRLASQAIDNNFATRWESVWGIDPQWIDLDFGAKVFVNRVQIAWLHACASNYDLQVSNDATTWLTMRSIAGNTTGSSLPPADWSTAVDHQGLVGFGRYVRVNATARCVSLYGYSMWEMRVFGDRNASCSP